MIEKIKKLYTAFHRDGVLYTCKRLIAWSISKTFLWNIMSFSYNNARLVFAPTGLTYGLFADSHLRSRDNVIFKKYIKEGNVVIDVGAHIGSLSVVAGSLVGPRGSVLAFEPVKKFYNILSENIKYNKMDSIITPYNIAVGASKGQVYINEDVSDDTTNYVDRTFKTSNVEQSTLDFYTMDIAQIDFLKIDVEGYEYEVLRGAIHTLLKTKIIYIEFITDNLERLSVNPDDVVEMLLQYFTLYTYQQNRIENFNYVSGQRYHTDIIGIRR